MPEGKQPVASLALGAPATGKTQGIVSRVQRLLEEGAQPEGILVVAATPTGKERLAECLSALGSDAADVRLRTAREVAVEMLSAPEAQRLTGRSPRLLLPFEEAMLLEDLQLIGMKPRRLREMSRFIFKSMTETLGEPDWVESGEESCALDMIDSCLRFYGGMLRYELPGVAYRLLREHPEAVEGHRADHVLVDDLHLLCRASQRLACALARESLHGAGDPEPGIEAVDPYPYSDWAEDLASAYPSIMLERLEEQRCCEGSKRMSELASMPQPEDFLPSARIRERAATALAGAASRGVRILKGQTPDDEMGLVAAYIEELIGQGTHPEAIFVATPHGSLAAKAKRALHARGIPCASLVDPRALATDTRDMRKSALVRAVTLLSLIADPDDGVSWRAWCGFGLPTGAAGGMRAIMDSRAYRSLPDALGTNDLESCPIPPGMEMSTTMDLGAIKELAGAARGAIAKLSSLKGTELARTLARTTSGGDCDLAEETARKLVALCQDEQGRLSPDDDAATLMQRVHERIHSPSFGTQPAVRVGSFADGASSEPDAVVLAGFVDGLIVSRDYFDPDFLEKRDRLWQEAVSKVRFAGSGARKALAVSFFESIDVEEAERLRLNVERIRSVGHAKRVARTLPSVLATAFID